MSVQRTGPRGAAQFAGLAALKNILPDLLPNATAIGSVNNLSFSQKVEKHISDYRSGNGQLSEDVGSEISARAEALAGTLDPKASKNLSLYATGMRYDHKARYLNNLTVSLSKLKDIVA